MEEVEEKVPKYWVVYMDQECFGPYYTEGGAKADSKFLREDLESKSGAVAIAPDAIEVSNTFVPDKEKHKISDQFTLLPFLTTDA